jgi:hypothetical protein
VVPQVGRTVFSIGQQSLGLMYLVGHGVRQDHTEALKWLRRAADQGLAHSEFFVGFRISDGRLRRSSGPCTGNQVAPARCRARPQHGAEQPRVRISRRRGRAAGLCRGAQVAQFGRRPSKARRGAQLCPRSPRQHRRENEPGSNRPGAEAGPRVEAEAEAGTMMGV